MADSHTDDLPLRGLRIVEVANVVAGPSVGRHLSDFGAEVIKVESLEHGDAARTLGEPLEVDGTDSPSAWWTLVGRNKRTIALDLSSPAGHAAFLRLIDTADALVDSFRPGVLERLDLEPGKLQERNEKLIVLRISGFGQTGPYRSRPGFGTLAEAYAGLAAISGEENGPPLLAPAAIADEITGLVGTWSLLAALYHRDVHGGPGQTIDVSLYESLLSVLGPLPALYQHRGYLQPRRGSRLPFSSPRNVYETRDGHHFVVSGSSAPAAERAVKLVGGEELLADPRFASADARREHADDLDAAVAKWFAQHEALQVEAMLEEAGVAGMRVMTMADIFEDEHYRARGSIVEVPDERHGSIAMAAPVPRMSRTPGRIAWSGRDLGEDTAAVLRELGFDDDEIEQGHAEEAW